MGLGAPQTDAVVRREEGHEGGAGRTGTGLVDEARETRRITTLVGVESDRRQGEVISQLGFLAAEVAHVVDVRHVRLGQEQYVRRDRVEHRSPQPDHLVGLGKVDRGRAGVLPEEAHGVQPKHGGVPLHVAQKDRRHPD